MSSACCPAGSWPALASQSNAQGSIETIDSMHGITAYIAKPPSESQSNGIGILSFQDIHPFDSARHFQVADTFAQLGYTVVHMDITGANFFANTDFSRIFEWVRSYPYDDGEKLNLTVEAAMRFLKNPKHNITKIAAIGFCWGSLMIFQACAAGAKIEAAVCYHPSLRLNQAFGGSPDCTDMTTKITTPIYLMSCENDPPFVKPGGSTITELVKTSPRSKAYEFKNMQHGFVNRGDVNDESVRANVKKAIEMTSEFFREMLS